MRQLYIALALILTGCGNSLDSHSKSDASKEASKTVEAQKRAIWFQLSTAEKKYIECIRTMGRRFGSPQQVTFRQAETAAKDCQPYLRPAAIGRRGRNEAIERIDRQAYGYSLPSQEQITASGIPYIENIIENEAMQQISAAVRPLPPT